MLTEEELSGYLQYWQVSLETCIHKPEVSNWSFSVTYLTNIYENK